MSFRVRRHSAKEWYKDNPILDKDQPGMDTNTNRLKYGDGKTRWNALPFATGSSENSGLNNTDVKLKDHGSTIGITKSLNGEVILEFSSVWGINSSGVPYYDPAGATPGESAIFSIQGDGSFVITKPTGVNR